MRYLTTSIQTEEIRNIADEILFGQSQANLALEYAEQHRDKRILLSITSMNGEHDIPAAKLFEFTRENENFYIVFNKLSDLVNYGKTYRNEDNLHIIYGTAANTWALVQILKYYKVSDIVIAEPLVFQLPLVEKNITQEGIGVRVNPSVCRPKIAVEVGSGIEHFFILPQHVQKYEGIITSLDLVDADPIREAALMKVYHEYNAENPFNLSMNIIIQNMNCPLPATLIDDDFVARRMNCRQRCMESDNSCHLCKMITAFYEGIQNRSDDKN